MLPKIISHSVPLDVAKNWVDKVINNMRSEEMYYTYLDKIFNIFYDMVEAPYNELSIKYGKIAWLPEYYRNRKDTLNAIQKRGEWQRKDIPNELLLIVENNNDTIKINTINRFDICNPSSNDDPNNPTLKNTDSLSSISYSTQVNNLEDNLFDSLMMEWLNMDSTIHSTIPHSWKELLTEYLPSYHSNTPSCADEKTNNIPTPSNKLLSTIQECYKNPIGVTECTQLMKIFIDKSLDKAEKTLQETLILSYSTP